MYTVYALIDPRDDLPFYIGITDDVYKRFAQHLQCSGTNLDKNERIQGLKNDNLMLIMRTLEVVETVEDARKREQHWIHYYLSRGLRLLNIDIHQTFTYEQFQAFFEQKSKQQKRVRQPVDNTRGAARQRLLKAMKRYPHLTPSQMAEKANVTPQYASRVVKQVNQ